MIDFPSSPTVDQEFTTGDYTYKWNGVAWVSVPSGSGSSGIPDAPSDTFMYGRQDADWGRSVSVAGDEMTGGLSTTYLSAPTISIPGRNTATLMMNKTGDGQANDIWGQRESNARWKVTLGDVSSEAGSNAGSNLTIDRYSDLGAPIGTALKIDRATGRIVLAGTGDATGYGVIVQPATTGYAGIGLQKTGEDQVNIITGYSGKTPGSIRWHIIPGGTDLETGANEGADFAIHSHDDAGAFLATAFKIKRSTGDAIFSTSNGVQIVATGHAAITLDKPHGLTAGINGLSGGATRWSLRIPDADAELGTNTGSSFGIWRYDDAGNPIDKPFMISRDTGTIFCNGYVNVAADITINSSVGLRMVGTSTDGSTYYLQQPFVGNPNWGTIDFRTRHNLGQWAGIEFTGSTGVVCTIDFVLSGAGGFGSIWAGEFLVQSDADAKISQEPVPSALDVLDGIQAYTYLIKPRPRDAGDTTPIYGADIRNAGSMAQDWQSRLPEVVKMHNGTLGLDYAGIGAITAQAISELLQRVKALEAQVATLEGTP
jgi:hypothetical protein